MTVALNPATRHSHWCDPLTCDIDPDHGGFAVHFGTEVTIDGQTEGLSTPAITVQEVRRDVPGQAPHHTLDLIATVRDDQGRITEITIPLDLHQALTFERVYTAKLAALRADTTS